MSRFRIELGSPADDADLRHILAATPMQGHIALRLEREPSWCDAAVVDGHFRQVIACRDTATGRVVGFGCRSIREVYVNGRCSSVGYLSNLRLLEEYRNRGLVARGYALLRKLHRDGRVPIYLTTIAEGNQTAIKVLLGERAGLPAYYPAGSYHTMAIPLRRRKPLPVSGRSEIQRAGEQDLPAIVEFLNEVGPRRQFFPHYRIGDFGPTGLLRDLNPNDLFVAQRNGRIVGVLGRWDQHGFRQYVVDRYHGLLRIARPFINAWSRILGRMTLPSAGKPLRFQTAAVPVIANDDPDVFRSLLESVQATSAGGPWSHLLLGLHEADPLLPIARHCQAACYTTNLHLVCWSDGEAERLALDGRPPYLELGSL